MKKYYVVVNSSGLAQACVTNKREAKSIARDLADDFIWYDEGPFTIHESETFIAPLEKVIA